MWKLISNLIILSLCTFYSICSIFSLIILFVTNYHKKFWLVKPRPTPPKCLTDTKYGQHKFIKANGLNFHYVENGDHSKPLMLFIHGFPEFWYSWRYQLKEFSNDYWCVAVDMRGYGDSDKPKEKNQYHIDILADDIKEIAHELGRDKFYLVAHDWGAVIGFHYVMKYMNTLEKYILLDAPPSRVWKKSVFSEWDQFKKSWYVFFFQAPILPEFFCRLYDLKIMRTIGNYKINENFTEEDLEAYKYTFSKPNAFTPPINYYRNTAANTLKIKFKTPENFVPGLYLLGENDKYISKASGAAAMKLYKNLQFKIIPNANHFAQQDAPTVVNKLMRDFLEQ